MTLTAATMEELAESLGYKGVARHDSFISAQPRHESMCDGFTTPDKFASKCSTPATTPSAGFAVASAGAATDDDDDDDDAFSEEKLNAAARGHEAAAAAAASSEETDAPPVPKDPKDTELVQSLGQAVKGGAVASRGLLGTRFNRFLETHPEDKRAYANLSGQADSQRKKADQ